MKINGNPLSRVELMAALPKGTVGAEIGVLRGKFARIILDKARPSLLYLVDAWSAKAYDAEVDHMGAYDDQDYHEDNLDVVLETFADELCLGEVKIKRGLSVEIASRSKKQSLDWIFIDARHDYESVLADLRAWAPIVREDGMISGHDFKTRNSGVANAVHKFRQESPMGELHITDEGRNSSFWFSKGKP